MPTTLMLGVPPGQDDNHGRATQGYATAGTLPDRGVTWMRETARVMTVMVALSVASAVAADWPSIYGPRRDNTSDQERLLRAWPETGPKVLWTAPVSVGFGGPAVSDGKV
jgi:hypothetical protein